MKRHSRKQSTRLLGGSCTASTGFDERRLIGCCAALVTLIVTTSLPFALAPAFPRLALTLNPNNPEALLAEADHLREALLKTSASSNASADGTGEESDPTNPKPFQPAQAKAADLLTRERGLLAMRALAQRAIASDPLDAKAYRLLGETELDPEHVHRLMTEALHRSRRETLAVLWLLDESVQRKDFETTLGMADILFRTEPALAGPVTGRIVQIMYDEGGLAVSARALGQHPVWRPTFLAALPQHISNVEFALPLLRMLKAHGGLRPMEVVPLLDFFVATGRVDLAYTAWLMASPQNAPVFAPLLANGSFATLPDGTPFDWRLKPGLNAIAEIVPPRLGEPEGALHLAFGAGRVTLPEISQVLYLPEGKYLLEGEVRGTMKSKRGLRWQLACARNPAALPEETAPIIVDSDGWRKFSSETAVTTGHDCPGQVLRLVHDARFASEQFFSGEVWFRNLTLTRNRLRPSPSQ